MLEYSLEEATALLQKNLDNATALLLGPNDNYSGLIANYQRMMWALEYPYLFWLYEDSEDIYQLMERSDNFPVCGK
ncbi:hypothetical protein RYX36_011229, partial [Vicia faba]